MVVQRISQVMLIACIAISLAPAGGYAHTPGRSRASAVVSDSLLNLPLFIAQVLERNPGLQAERSRSRALRSRVPQAGAWDDPQAGVEFYSTPITSGNPLRDGMETDYFLQQMVPFPGKKGAMADAAEAGARMGEERVLAAERDLIDEAKRVYAMLYTAQRRAAVNVESRRLLDQIIASARSKYSVGMGNQGDVLKVQVELASLENERAALEQEAASALAMLNALRNAPHGIVPGTVTDPAVPAPPPSLDSLTLQAGDARPELRAMRYEVAMNRSELSASRKEWLPDIMIKGTYKQMMDQTDQWAAMVGINIPFAPWSIGRTTGKVEENEAALKASEESLRNMENMVQAEILDLYARARSRWEQIGRYQKAILPQTQQALDANMASYRNDRIDFLSLLDSYRMLQMFRMEYYMVLGEYLANLAALERAVGADLR